MPRARSHLVGSASVVSPSVALEPSALSSDLLTGHLESLLRSPLFEAVVHRGREQNELRDRVLTVPLLALLLVHYVLQALPSWAALLRRLADGHLPGLPALTVTRQAFGQRLRDVPHTLLLSLLVDASRTLRASPWRRPWVSQLAPWATGIFALDDTTLDALLDKLGWLAELPKGAPERLAGRLGCLLDLTTGKLAEVLYDDDSGANEKTHLRPLLQRLTAGSLVVMDLGYFCFELFDWMHQQQLVFVTRLKAKVTYRVDRVLADRPLYRDRLIVLGTAPKGDRCATTMRLVELCLDGKWLSYLTNELDPQRLPAEAVWALYGERWTIEMAFAAIKISLGLAKLRSNDLNAALGQIWMTLLLFQVLQDLRLQIATEAGWKADDVSWQKLLERIESYVEKPSPKMSLHDWLLSRATKAGLKKEGQRVRKLRQLPDAVAADCDLTPLAALSVPSGRTNKYKGKRKSEREAAKKRGSQSRSVPTVVGLLPVGAPSKETGGSA